MFGHGVHGLAAIGAVRMATAEEVYSRRHGGAIYVGRSEPANLLTRGESLPETDADVLHDFLEIRVRQTVSSADTAHHRPEPGDYRFELEREIFRQDAIVIREDPPGLRPSLSFGEARVLP